MYTSCTPPWIHLPYHPAALGVSAALAAESGRGPGLKKEKRAWVEPCFSTKVLKVLKLVWEQRASLLRSSRGNKVEDWIDEG